ncbi:MAG TPA: aminotransferase class I/II-fold pyridoxal phosphate-dependent enzyme [Lachnospiraceae bacterium]|nr:aminotransferase class I/II-fold pyridoxal phosphate-dependent enzyme [Lachnospiraceae bacterium]
MEKFIFDDMSFHEDTRLLYEGQHINGMELSPEAFPLFATSAFNMGDLDNVAETYEKKGYTYIRTRNPNRKALADVITFLEQGEDSLIFSSGMGAITTTYFALLQPGDHFLCNENIYGETFDAIKILLHNYGVETDFAPFDDLDAVRACLKPNTKMLYTEVASNPTDRLCDIEELAKIAHGAGALLMVDNTFTTPVCVKPLTLGADIIINSLTKFLNGHSDALAGSITVKDKALFDKIHTIRMLTGTSGCPFASWMIFRGIHTADLRIRKQCENAALLAQALSEHPHVICVNHPSVKSHPQYELGKKLFTSPYAMTGMLSFEMPDDREKINAFMNKLHIAHYAPTLGGIRTTLSYPLLSSHMHVPEKELKKMHISGGLMRVSTGIENADDLIADFYNALSVFA